MGKQEEWIVMPHPFCLKKWVGSFFVKKTTTTTHVLDVKSALGSI